MKPKSRADRLREAILLEWRGAEEPKNLDADMRPAGDFVAQVLKAVGISEGLHEEEVRETWSELAGDFIARHSQPLSVKHGTLVLQVTQPAMRFHLEQMKPMLLKRIQATLGEQRVRAIKFVLG